MAPRKVNSIPAQPTITTPTDSSVQIMTWVYGPPVFREGVDTAIPGTPVDLITLNGAVPPATRYLAEVRVVCSVSGEFVVRLNGAIIASGLTRPGKSESDYKWPASRPFALGDTVKVQFTASTWSPVGATVRAYLVCGDLPPA